MLSLKIKLDLYTSLIVSTATYASETWKSTARICQKLDVFHQHNLRKILGITWKDHVPNMELLSWTGQRRLQDIVAERRLRMAGHIIRTTWTTSQSRHVMDLVVVADDEVVQRRHGGPHLKKTRWAEESIGTRPGCGYKQKQMANSCCPLSCQGPEDLNAK